MTNPESARACANGAPAAQHPRDATSEPQRPNAPREAASPIAVALAGQHGLDLAQTQAVLDALADVFRRAAVDAARLLQTLGEHLAATFAPLLEHLRELHAQHPELFESEQRPPAPRTGPPPPPLDPRRRRRR